MRKRGIFAKALTLAILVLAATGCGSEGNGGDDDGGPTDPPPPPPPPGPPPPPPPPPLPGVTLSVASGGNNVPDRYTSDLWVHGDFAYTGTWGGFPRGDNAGDALKIWSLDGSGAPSLVDSIITPMIGTVSDVEVSADGQVLMFSAERGE